jgi:predicted CoA-binding protein
VTWCTSIITETEVKAMATDYRRNLLERIEDIAPVLARARRVAVLGIKTERQGDQPAFYVPAALAAAGLDVVPVPVYYPDATEILGQPVFRKLTDIPGPLDIVDVFRRTQDIDQHVDDILAKAPDVVWFQSGIRNDPAAERFARAGIKVVQDR